MKMKTDNPQKRYFVRQNNSWILKEPICQVVKRFGNLDAYPLLDVLVVKQGKLYGLINLNGEWAVPCQYKEVEHSLQGFHNDSSVYDAITLTTPDNKQWIADRNGHVVHSDYYDCIGSSNYYKYRYSNEAWNHFIEVIRYIPDPTNPCVTNRYCGLFDLLNMREVIPPIYSPGAPDINDIYGIYSSGIPIFHRENDTLKCKLIDAQGKELIPFEAGFEHISVPPRIDDDEYLFPAMKNGKWGYINIYGTEKIPFKYDDVSDFHEKFAIVGFCDEANDTAVYGIIDHYGNIKVPIKYQNAPSIYRENGIVYARIDANTTQVLRNQTLTDADT